MTDYVLFTNDSEIPINAFKLLGASSKRGDDSKIGYYGTGLKYAIALMLRENISFKIFSGKNEVKIGKRATKFLDQKIEVMTVNNEKTSITLDAGIDWEPWFAIREIYSNTIDEGGSMKIGAELQPEAGKTKIYIDLTSESLSDIFKNWNDYFTTSREIQDELENGNILPKLPSNPYYTVFRKGIRAYDNKSHSLFDYDLQNLQINESRVAKFSWEAEELSSKLLAKASLATIKQFIHLGEHTDTREYAEWQNSFWEYTSVKFSQDWLTAIDNRKLVPNDCAGRYDITEMTLVLPDKLLKRLKESFGDAIHIVGQDDEAYTIAEDVDLTTVEEAMNLLSSAGLTFERDAVCVANFVDTSILGTVDHEKILLSTRLLDDQSTRLENTLLEEITHLKTGYGDCSREMQTYLFRTIIYLIKHGRKLQETK
jgi:hypothetical protein